MIEWLSLAPNWVGLGAGAGGGFYAARWLLEWFSGRFDKRTQQLDDATARLIEAMENRLKELTNRLKNVEGDLDACKRNHAESEARVLKLEALVLAYGEGRQHAQNLVSIEREKDRRGE